MIRKQRVMVVGCGAMAMGLLVSLLAGAGATDGGATGSQSATSTAPAAGFGAIAYYDQSCSHCHGPQGSFYGPTLGQKLTDAQLVKVVKDMAEGPGGAPLTPVQVEIETAFHRALIEKTPFVSVTGISGEVWTGEVMPDATVTVKAGGKPVEAVVDGWTWTATLPVGTLPRDVTVTATREGKPTVVGGEVGVYSHKVALLPPEKR